MKKYDRTAKIRQLQLVQVVLVLALSLIAYFVSGNNAAFSSMLGGFVALLPALLFTKIAFSYTGARAAKKIVKQFYKAEALKVGLSFFLFTIVFLLYKIQPLAFFLTYITVILAHWCAPLFIDNHYK